MGDEEAAGDAGHAPRAVGDRPGGSDGGDRGAGPEAARAAAAIVAASRAVTDDQPFGGEPQDFLLVLESEATAPMAAGR